VGLHTNVAFLRRVVVSRSFAEADLDTALIERERAALFNTAPLPAEIAAAGVVAHALASEQALQTNDPWSQRDGWRLFGGARRQFDLELHGQHQIVVLERAHRGAMLLAIGAQRWPFAASARGDGKHDVQLGERRISLSVYAVGERVSVFAPEGSATVNKVDVLAHAGEGAVDGGRLTAPMPGKVIAFLAQPGQSIKQGQALAVMEAMKMEHTITSPRDGTVEALLYAPGDQVAEGGELLKLAAL
jgi:3-methylcrotonyl-CoA carboxylase alpha subunit